MKTQLSYFCFVLRLWKTTWYEKHVANDLAGNEEPVFREHVNRHFDELYHYIILRVKSPEVARTLLKRVCLGTWRDHKFLSHNPYLSDHLLEVAQPVIFDYFKSVARDEKLQGKLWRSISIAQNDQQAPDIDQAYSFIIRSIQNNFLQQQLLYKLTSIQRWVA